LKIEVSGATKEELRRQLEDVIRELDKINFGPGNRITLSNPQAWKTVTSPQAFKTLARLHPSWNIGKTAPNIPGSLRAWTVTYET
jgi:hypothetical protein